MAIPSWLSQEGKDKASMPTGMISASDMLGSSAATAKPSTLQVGQASIASPQAGMQSLITIIVLVAGAFILFHWNYHR
jgi:hypothetical protein